MIVTRAPFAPVHLLGLGNTAPQGTPYPDQGFDIPFDITLTASQVTQQEQIIERDADFVLRAIVLGSVARQTATSDLYAVQFDVNGWYKFSPAPILAGNLQSDPSAPYVVFPELTIPAGGRIGILFNELSAAPNTIEIVFRGVKRFPQTQ